ncbi:MAG: hypothetical protein WC661_19760 [Opitutaceae bacterium]|jgi:hypothetical protein
MSNDEITAAALALPRSARLRLASAMIAKEGDAERAADLEALARSAEMDEDPARFVVSGENMKAFTRKLRAKYSALARSKSPKGKRAKRVGA